MKTDSGHTWTLIGVSTNVTFSRLSSWHFLLKRDTHEVSTTPTISLHNSTFGSVDLQPQTKAQVKDCFMDARLRSSPTLISATNATVSVANCRFSRFKSKHGPTILLGMNNSHISITNTSIIKNRGVFGTIFLANNCSINFTTVLIADNFADNFGFSSVLFWNGIFATISNSHIANNRAVCGGAVWASNYTHLEVINTTFQMNEALQGGAIMLQNNTRLVLRNSKLLSNQANWVKRRQDVAVYSSIASPSLQMYLKQARFQFRFSDDFGTGGAIVGKTKCEITIHNSAFVDNSAETSGGALFLVRAKTVIRNSTFLHNLATKLGGVLLLHDQDNTGNINYQRTKMKNEATGFTGKWCTLDIQDTVFKTNQAKEGGCVLGYGNITVNIENSQFLSNGGTEGGAVNIHHSKASQTRYIRVASSVFSKNLAVKGGAIMLHHYTNASMENCTFLQNSAFHGAAVYAFINVTVQVEVCVFSKNNGKGRAITVPDSIEDLTAAGGTLAIHDHSRLHVFDSIFRNNTSELGTGTVTLYRYVTAVVERCSFHGNAARWGGALFAMSHVNVYITQAIFSKNMAQFTGGAFDGGPNVNFCVSATTFSGNYAVQGAGVNVQKKSTFHLVDCIFKGQNSSMLGGGLVLDSNASGNISNCLFIDNIAGLKGGGMFAGYKSKCEILNSTFKSNTADLGGALYMESEVKLTVSNNYFTENRAKSHGGSMYGRDFVQTELQNNTFYNNSAVDGGALWLKVPSVLTVRNTNFTGNQALSSGGALLMETDVKFTFVPNHLGQNGAQHEGVFAQKDTTNSPTRQLTLTLRTTESQGGVISGCHLSMDRCLLTGNRANRGGALEVKNCKLKISNSKLNKNEAYSYGGALYLRDDASWNVSHSQLSQNKAHIGGAIYSKNNVTLIVSDVNFRRNIAYFHGSSIVGETNIYITIILATFKENSDAIGNIYMSGGGRFEVSNGTFVNNEGTVIVLVNVTGSIDRSLFQQNISPDKNSRTVVTDGSDLFMNNTLFHQNEEGVLTAIGDERSSIHIENSRFSKNSVVDDGHIFQIVSSRHSSFVLTNSEVVESSGHTILVKGNMTSQFFNCTFSKNDGRVLTFFDLSENNVKYCLFKKNAASEGAAVTAQNVRSIYVIQCTFYNNTAKNAGGAIYIPKSALAELTGCTFKGNKAWNGGSIWMKQMTYFTISHSNFSDNIADNFGGAVALRGVTGSIENCHFSKNQAQYGGACDISQFVKLDIKKCHFENNYSHLEGGAIYAVGNTSLHIFKSVFFQNKAGDSGGASSLSQESTGNIFQCSFTENVAKRYGAVVAHIQTSLDLYHCEFRNNFAHHEGGAVGAYSHSSLNISRSMFLRNRSDGPGGALLVVYRVYCVISESSFVSNNATHGGAIEAFSQLEFTVSKCIFDGNIAEKGGTLTFLQNSNISVHDTAWVGNVASYGGAMLLHDNVRCTIERSNFDRNKAHQFGGAVLVIDATVHFTETNFTSNDARGSGGAMTTLSSKVLITSCMFSTNHANLGGVFFTPDWGNIQVQDSSFTDNSAHRGGVGIVVSHSFLKIEGSTLANNTADEAGTLFLTEMVTVEILNTKFFNNTARITGVTHIQNHAKVYLKGVTFNGNYETVISWLWILAYIKPYLSKTIGLIFHGIAGTSGVMTVDSLSYVMVDDCLFIENSAMHAGVLLVHNASVTINNSKFIDNNAQFVGVFEAAYNVQMELSNTSFKGNQARLADIGRIMASSNVNITNITVHGTAKNRLHFVNIDVAHQSSLRLKNSSLRNIIGAYYMFRVWDSSHMFASGVLLENNLLYGISYVSRGSTLTMETCNITDNKIEDSIITLEGRSTADIRNTSIKDNVLLVSLKGGSLFHVTQNSTLIIAQSQFSENFAAKGELISVQDNSSFIIDNCTFANNTAEYGVLLCKATDFVVFNQTWFVSNEAFVSGGVTFSENCGIRVVNSRMTRNKAQHYGGCVMSTDGILEVRKFLHFGRFFSGCT